MVSQLSGSLQGMSGIATAAGASIAGITIAVGASVAALVGLTRYVGAAIEQTVAWNSETKKLARVLGTTQQEATALAVALDDSFVSSETYLGGVNKLTKGLESNESLFKSMGVALKETDGSYRNTNDIMLDTLTAFSKMEDSTEKNIAMQRIYGKSWQEMLPALEVANKIQNAREEVERFGLATDPKVVKAYREALDDVGDVFDYLKISVGKEFMPVVTELLSTFASLGKEYLPPVIDGIKTLAFGYELLVAYIKKTLNESNYFFQSIFKAFGTAADVVQALIRLDFSGAKNAFTEYGRWILEEGERVQTRSNAIMGQANYNGMKRFMPQPPSQEKKSSLNLDLEDEEKKKAKERLEAEKKLYEFKMASYDADIAKAKGNYDLQIKIAKDREALVIKTYGAESKEAINAAKLVEDLERKKLEELNKVSQLKQDAIRAHSKAEIDLDNLHNEQLRRQKQISEEELIQRKIANNEKLYQLELEGLQQRLDVAGLEPSERQKIMNDIEALQDNHNKSMTQLNEQLNNEMRRTDGWEGARQSLQTYIDGAQNSFQVWGSFTSQLLGGVESSFSRAIGGILQGTMSMGQAIKAVWQGILGTVAQAIAQLIAKYITLKIAKAALAKAEAVSAGATAAANLMMATAEIHAAHDWIPFVGVGIANGFVALMNASFAAQKGAVAGLTAFAVGGLIDKPTLSLMGEAGPEVVAPERDFKDWAGSLVVLGSSLQGSVNARQASATQGYVKQLAKLERSTSERASEPRQTQSVQHITVNGALDAVSVAKQIRDLTLLAAQVYD